MRDYLQKLGVRLYYVELVAHKLSNLPEKYENIVENLENELDDDMSYYEQQNMHILVILIKEVNAWVKTYMDNTLMLLTTKG